MSSNGEVHGAKLQRENTALTAARLNEGSKTSISTSHEMKGKIVDVNPLALQRRWGKNKAVGEERRRGGRLLRPETALVRGRRIEGGMDGWMNR